MSGNRDVPAGLELARIATELEVRGQTAEALEKYRNALALLLKGLKTLNERWVKDLVREKFELYCERAEILKKVIEQRQKSNPVKKSLPVATPVSAPGSSRKIAQISPHSPRVAIPSRSVPSSSLSIPYPISDAPSRAENARGILTHSQKLHFIKNGFVIIRNVIPPDICEKCIDYIEEGQRGEGQTFMDRILSNVTIAHGKIKSSNKVVDLWHKTPLRNLARCLSPSLRDPMAAQVAPLAGKKFQGGKGINDLLRKFGSFAVDKLDLANKWRLWHIDGVKIARHGIDPGKISNFTLLAGVYLTDISSNFAGNFTVFPGSHHAIEAVANKVGTEHIAKFGLPAEDLLLKSPIQLKVNKGDVVLAHYMLAHAVAPNLSDNTRHAVYFRTFHRDHSHFKFRHESMKQKWLEFEGLHPLL